MLSAKQEGSMHRGPTPPNPDLESLLDERDDLQIKKSLALDAPKPDPEAIDAISWRIFELDRRISAHWRNPNN
jgi:hypothetical protein